MVWITGVRVPNPVCDERTITWNFWDLSLILYHNATIQEQEMIPHGSYTIWGFRS